MGVGNLASVCRSNKANTENSKHINANNYLEASENTVEVINMFNINNNEWMNQFF